MVSIKFKRGNEQASLDFSQKRERTGKIKAVLEKWTTGETTLIKKLGVGTNGNTHSL